MNQLDTIQTNKEVKKMEMKFRPHAHPAKIALVFVLVL